MSELGWGDPGYCPEDAACNRPCGSEPMGCVGCEFAGNYHRTERTIPKLPIISDWELCSDACKWCGSEETECRTINHGYDTTTEVYCHDCGERDSHTEPNFTEEVYD